VNPIVKKSAGSIINKVGDYAAAGLAVINTQESLEYRNLLEKYNCGINCENGNCEDVAKAIEWMIDHPLERIAMGKQARKMAEDLFDRDKSYQNIQDYVRGIYENFNNK
jgi:glycosyltransferase involved in cell wall biosynthesis